MELREYYEKEARLLSDHQRRMYFGDPWAKYWHGTRFAVLLEIMKSLKFRSFLDVGCAEGYYLAAVASKADSQEQVGLDISKGYLIKAKVNASEAAFVLGDASSLPFKTGCFDLVFCSELLEHIQDPKNFQAAGGAVRGGHIVVAHQQDGGHARVCQAFDTAAKLALKGGIGALVFVGVAGKNADVGLPLQGNVNHLAQASQKINHPAIQTGFAVKPPVIFHADVDVGQVK